MSRKLFEANVIGQISKPLANGGEGAEVVAKNLAADRLCERLLGQKEPITKRDVSVGRSGSLAEKLVNPKDTVAISPDGIERIAAHAHKFAGKCGVSAFERKFGFSIHDALIGQKQAKTGNIRDYSLIAK